MAFTRVRGPGITTDDNYRVGIITATKFVGPMQASGDSDFTNISATGIGTIDGVKIGDPSGIVTASSSSGIVTYYGDASKLTGLTAGQIPNLDGAKITSGTVAAARIDNLAASKITSGTVATARLGSGTANSSTFLRGDGSWASNTSTVINNNANNRLITGSGTANTLEGESGLTFDGSTLSLTPASSNAGRVTIFGSEGQDARLSLVSDEGDDHIDQYNLRVAASNNRFYIDQFESGAFQERFTIANGGRIGINTITPTAQLDVEANGSGYITEFRQKASNNSAQIIIDSPTDNNLRPASIDLANAGTIKWSLGQAYSSSSSGAFHIATSSLSSNDNGARLTISTAGRTGIGTDNPNTKLDVLDSNAEGILSRAASIQNTNTNKAFKVRNAFSSTDTFNVSYRGQGYFADKVGIGTDNPTYKLHVDSGDAAIGLWKSRRSSGSYIEYAVGADGAALGYIGAGGQIIASGVDAADFAIRSQGDLCFASGGSTERLRITSGGQVNIGGDYAQTTWPLQVDIGTSNDGALKLKNDEISLQVAVHGTGHTYGREVSLNATRVDSNNDYPDLRLCGQGGIKLCVDANTERLRLDSAGDLHFRNATTGHQGLKWYKDNSLGVSFTYGEGNANPTLNIYRQDAQSGFPYGNLIINTGDATTPTRALKLRTDKHIELTGSLIMASGQGMDFSATSDASGKTSELFDDYEEGLFTPSFSNGLTGSGYSYQHGQYTKIGRTVYWTLILHIYSGNDSTNGNVINIEGFPFTCLNSSPYQGGGGTVFYQDYFYDSTNGFGGIQIDNSTQLRLYKLNNGTYLTGSNVDGDRQIRMYGFYFTN